MHDLPSELIPTPNALSKEAERIWNKERQEAQRNLMEWKELMVHAGAKKNTYLVHSFISGETTIKKLFPHL